MFASYPNKPANYEYSGKRDIDKYFCESVPFLTVTLAAHIFKKLQKEVNLDDESVKRLIRNTCNIGYRSGEQGVLKGQRVYNDGNHLWLLSIDFFEEFILKEYYPFLDKIDEIYRYGEFLIKPDRKIKDVPKINYDYIRGFLVLVGTEKYVITKDTENKEVWHKYCGDYNPSNYIKI